VSAAQSVISQNLDTVESGVDISIETAKEAVHELREKAQNVAGETVRSAQRTLDTKRPMIERYMESHPWIVFAALLLLAYLFSSERKDESLEFQP
jgi:hypothetical protein